MAVPAEGQCPAGSELPQQGHMGPVTAESPARRAASGETNFWGPDCKINRGEKRGSPEPHDLLQGEGGRNCRRGPEVLASTHCPRPHVRAGEAGDGCSGVHEVPGRATRGINMGTAHVDLELEPARKLLSPTH